MRDTHLPGKDEDLKALRGSTLLRRTLFSHLSGGALNSSLSAYLL